MEEPGGLPSMGLHRVGHDWSDTAAASVYIHQSQTPNLPLPCPFPIGNHKFFLIHLCRKNTYFWFMNTFVPFFLDSTYKWYHVIFVSVWFHSVWPSLQMAVFFFLWLSQGFHRGHTTPDQTWSWTSDPEMTLWQLGKLSRDEPCHLVGCLPSALYRSRTAMEGTMRDPQSHPHLAKRAGSSELWWAGVGCRRSLHGTVSASQLCPLRSHAAAGGLLTSPSLFLHVQKDRMVPTPWVICEDSTG